MARVPVMANDSRDAVEPCLSYGVATSEDDRAELGIAAWGLLARLE